MEQNHHPRNSTEDAVAHASTHDQTNSRDEESTKESSKCQKFRACTSAFVIKHFLPISLIAAVVLGTILPQPGVFLNHKVTTYVCIAFMFLYMGLYLRTSAIKDAMKSWKAYIWGTISILCVTCIIGGLLTKLLNFDKLPLSVSEKINGNETTQTMTDSLGAFEFKIGIILYVSMPCTIASGVVMVSTLNGHFALAIMLTVVTNITAIFTVPLYIKWLMVDDANIAFDYGSIAFKLALAVLLPIVIGKTIRLKRRIREFITVPRRKTVLKMLNIFFLALILYVKVSVSSDKGDMKELTAKAACVIVFWILTLHVIFLCTNALVSFILRLPLDQKKCIIILASQKTLALAIPTSVFLPDALGDKGLIAVAMVFCHISIIVFDSLMISSWLYCEERKRKKEYETIEV